MRARWLTVLIAGCGAAPSAPSVGVVRTPAPPAPTLLYSPPPASAPPPFHIECHAFSPPSGPVAMPRSHKIYDFAAIPIVPVRRGPRAADRPRLGLGRATRELRLAFAGRAPEITDCWKAASSRGARPTTLEVGMTIEPLGGMRDLAVTSARASDDDLVACVKRALTGVTFTGAATRTIRLGATLDLRSSEQPAWAQPWPLHAMSAPHDERDGTACTPVLDDGVVPAVRLPDPLTVTDWDQSRDPPRRGAVPSVKIGCAISYFDADKRAVRTAIMSNLGAYQACYADARDRDPSLTGEVMLQMRFARNGAAIAPHVTGGPGDPAFHACLGAAMQEIWVTPGAREDAGIEVNIPLELAPPPAAVTTTEPMALLDAGDPDAALAAWTAQLRGPLPVQRACTARAGVVLAIARLSPWLDDARTRAAIADLASIAEQLPLPAAFACVEPVVPVIVDLTRTRGAPYSSWQLSQPMLERYAAALPLARFFDGGNVLRWYHATALLATPRAAEAEALLAKLAWDPEIGSRVADQQRARKDRREMISDTCLP